MRLLTVIPISKGIPKDALTYFTKEDIQAGSIVAIPVRKRVVYGLVSESREAHDLKTEIKGLPFAMRKIEHLKTRSFLSSRFIKSAEVIADYFAASVGAVLYALIPSAILDASSELPPPPEEQETSPTKPNILAETLVLQAEDEERYATYKSLIREEFARGKSVFFCAPTTEDLKLAKNSLEKGIEVYTYMLHGGLSKKDMLAIWKEALAEPHPVLLIATGSFLSIPRTDVGTIIVEKESSRGYKMQTRPFIDIRTAVEIFAHASSRRLILGDTLLRVETLWEEKNGRYAELSPLKFRSLSTATSEIISMRRPADMKKKEFAAIGPELSELIVSAKERNEHVFLFAGRKGLYPTTVCSDCGTVVTCNNCGAPVVLYGGKKVQMDAKAGSSRDKNLFVCHHCGERRDAHELCKYCKGWRLLPLGIGTERVEEEVKKLVDGDIFRMDKDAVATHREAVKVRDAFYKSPGGVMIGTEMALVYLSEKIENTAVVSMDSFFSIPDFRINEKIFHILLGLRALSEKRMIIQTRQEDTKIFENALRGNLIDFYRDEIEERKLVGYPPFTTYIKLSLSGERNTVRKEMADIATFLSPYELTIFDSIIPGTRAESVTHGLIALPKGEWIDKTLLTKLRQLPPQCQVKVDPDTLL